MTIGPGLTTGAWATFAFTSKGKKERRNQSERKQNSFSYVSSQAKLF